MRITVKNLDKVLFLGPDIKGKGGMESVLQSYSDYYTPFNYLPTNSHKGFVAGCFVTLATAAKIPFYRKKGVKILHIHHASGKSWFRKSALMMWGKLWGYKTIMHCHSGIVLDFYKKIGLKTARFVAQQANLNIVLTQGWLDYYKDTVGCDKVLMLKNIVAPSEYVAPNKSSKEITFVFLGAIMERKGIFDLLKAVKILKEGGYKFKLLIGGVGETKKMDSIIQEYQISDFIDYRGWVNPEQKKEVLENSDVLILPSYFEGLPISILEAMSYHRAVISTRITGVTDIVSENETGLLFEPGDIKALAKAMARYMDDTSLVMQHGETAAHRISEYYPEKIAKQLEEIYDSVL